MTKLERDAHGKGRYAYAITTHDVEDVRARMDALGAPAEAGGTPTMYCDTAGVCMFDDPQRVYMRAMESLLNDQAAQGQRLVQVLFRERQMIAIWETKREEA